MNTNETLPNRPATNTTLRIAWAAPFIAWAVARSLCDPVNAAEPLPWPSDGVFPAYPAESEDRGMHFYLFGTGVADDNLFRQSETEPPPDPDPESENELGDLYGRAGAGVDANLEWGRQKLTFDAQGDYYAFDRNSDLDNWLYGGNLNWNWQAGDNLSGTLGYGGSLAFPNFAELQSFSQDTIASQYAQFGADWRALSRMEIRLLTEASRQDHSDLSRSELDNRVASGALGLFYISTEETAVGVQQRISEGEYPNRQQVGDVFVDNQYRETESSFVVSKPFVTRLATELRVSYTERTHEEVKQRDFQGATGRLQLRYAPLPKILIYLSAYRELQPVDELSASYAVAEGATIGPVWAPTSTLVFQLFYSYEERLLQGDPGFVLTDSPPREDVTRSARIAMGYRPSDNFEITLAFERGDRDSNEAGADYQFNAGWLDFKVTL